MKLKILPKAYPKNRYNAFLIPWERGTCAYINDSIDYTRLNFRVNHDIKLKIHAEERGNIREALDYAKQFGNDYITGRIGGQYRIFYNERKNA